MQVFPQEEESRRGSKLPAWAMLTSLSELHNHRSHSEIRKVATTSGQFIPFLIVSWLKTSLNIF